MQKHIIKLVSTLLLLTAIETVEAAPDTGELRLALHALVSNSYMIDSDRFQSVDDIFAIALRELDVRNTTSSANLFAVGVFLHLEYRYHDFFSVGLRSGTELAFVSTFSETDLRIPILVTHSFVLADWFELQPELGINVSYNSRTLVAGPNLDVGLRIRLADKIDLHGGFVHGTISGFQFSVSVRLFNIFALQLQPEDRVLEDGVL